MTYILVIGLTALDMMFMIHSRFNEYKFVPVYCALFTFGIYAIKDIRLSEHINYNIFTEQYEGDIDKYVTKYKSHHNYILLFSVIKGLFICIILAIGKINEDWFQIVNICLTHLYPVIVLIIYVIPSLIFELCDVLRACIKNIKRKLWPDPIFIPLFNDVTNGYESV